MRSKSTYSLLILALTLTLSIGLFFGSIILDSRHETRQHAEETNRNLLATIEQSLTRSFDFCDLLLQNAITLLTNGSLDALPLSLQNAILFSDSDNTPGLGAMLVLDETGNIVRASNPLNLRSVDLSDRDYFRAHQLGPPVPIYISAPFRSRLDQEHSIALSKRINDADGQFAGVIVISLQLSYFQDLFRSVNIGANSGLNMLHTNGAVLIRFPYDNVDTGRTLAGTPNFGRFITEREGSFVGLAALDGIERLYTFRTLARYPIILNVAAAVDTIYAGWTRRAIALGATTLALMLGCIGLTLLMYRELLRRQAIAALLSKAENDLRIILNGMPSMIGYWDREMRNRFGNRAYMERLELSASEMKDRPMRELIGASEYTANLPHAKRALDGHRQVFESTIRDSSGRIRHTLCTYVPDIEHGRVQGFFEHISDITARKIAQEALFEEKERIRVTLRSIGDAVVSTSVDGIVDYLNPVAETMTGWPLEMAQGRDIDEVMDIRHQTTHSRVLNPIREALSQQRTVGLARDSILISRTGATFDIEDSAAPITDARGMLIGAVMVFHDVSESRALSSRMTHLAQHDALTDLPNRVLLQDRATRLIANAARAGTRLAVLYLDLDGFKNVNDSLGHDAGDELLVQFARRLQSNMRDTDTLSRQGGDEFVILMAEIADPVAAGQFARKLLQRCAEPFVLGGSSLSMSASIGVALFPDDGTTFEELAKNADTAMYVAKQAGRNRFQFFTKAHGVRAHERLAHEQALKNALMRDELFVEYQPKVDYRTGALTGMEALVRWRRDGQRVMPDDFIPLAEETGLIVELGRYVLHAVARDRDTLRKLGFPPVPVAVNVSARQFADPAFYDHLLVALGNTDGIELEITESVLMHDLEGHINLFHQIRKLGVRLSLDDFGMGYSSLSYLRRIPLDTLKIDRSFVSDLGRDDVGRGIAHAIIILAHHLGLDVVAEGVETQEQADVLLSLGCRNMQGYYFSRPLALDALRTWHQNRPAPGLTEPPACALRP